MPRATVHPIVGILSYFEEAPLADVTLALAVAKETVRRRTAGESVLTAAGPKIDPPGGKRAAAVAGDGSGKKKTAAAPKPRKTTAVVREEDRPLPGMTAEVGE